MTMVPVTITIVSDPSLEIISDSTPLTEDFLATKSVAQPAASNDAEEYAAGETGDDNQNGLDGIDTRVGQDEREKEAVPR